MTPADITQKMLVSWGGEDVFNSALVAAKKGRVLKADWNDSTHLASGEFLLPNGVAMKTGFVLQNDGHIWSKCPCRMNQEGGLVCPHVVAVGLYLMCRMTDPEAEEKYQAERRAAQRAAAVDASAYVTRSPNGIPMRMSFNWGENFREEFYAGGVRAHLEFVDAKGTRYRPEDPRLRGGRGIAISDAAENLLGVLEDICGGPAASEILLKPADFLNVLDILNSHPAVECAIQAQYDEATGHFALSPVADVPFAHDAGADRFIVNGRQGFVWSRPSDGAHSRGRFFKLAKVLAGPFQSVYRKSEDIPREAMASFLFQDLRILRQQAEVRLSLPEDLFRFRPGAPVIRLHLSGSRASLGADLYARYGKQEIVCAAAAAPHAICQPDPDDRLLYHVRNLEAEQAAIETLLRFGFERGEGSRYFVTEPRGVLNVLGGAVPQLRRQGWKVGYSERLEPIVDELPMVLSTVDVADGPDGAFDVGYVFDVEGRSGVVSQSDVQEAMNHGDSYVMKGGRTYLLDTDAISSMRKVFEDCSTRQGGAAAGRFRVDGVYSAYVGGALWSLGDAVEVEAKAAPNWRESSAQRNVDEAARYEAVPLGRLEGTLRPYQKQGVYWMRFLEKSGLSGLLADEMGLGKTLQTLTWISLARTDPDARGKPALVVCPTSLVQNWNAEAEKFTPWMKRLVVSGPDRAAAFKRIPDADIVITSYALLQRDVEDAYLGVTFSVVVLDEAQHIKNRSTRNAKAAKQLQSVQRLVLTGTPVENSVADVWSIFDFLMPDYLGRYDVFKANVQEPIEAGGAEGRSAQERLRHKLDPFILRRLKQTVAKDLPEKIVKVAYCPMTSEQQRWYNRLLQEARGKIGDMVKARGFAKAKFEILALLMRLRQVASDLELLKEYREKAGKSAPADPTELSGKLEAFLELLDEAVDGGHRVLVFSQFVSMLAILRRELDARGVRYCYLDGATKDRLGACRTFNTDESIPVFLISLHAGGTGLNLTGADMVVHFDPWWNPAVEAQATDRAHRIGQKRTVYVVKMIAQNSVEERVLALQQKKQLVIDATVGVTDEQIVQKLTYDDIKSIVGL